MERLVALIGCFAGATLSWSVSQSIGWAVFHFLCGWMYVAYWFFAYFLAEGAPIPYLT